MTVLGTAQIEAEARFKASHWKAEWAGLYKDDNRGDDYVLLRVRPSRLEVSAVGRGLKNDEKTWRPMIVNLPGEHSGLRIIAIHFEAPHEHQTSGRSRARCHWCAEPGSGAQKKYAGADGKLRVALAKQPLSPTGPSKGPATMADGGIQPILADLGATVRVEEARLTADEDTEYGGWKRLGMSLGHFADIVAQNERDGYFTVGLLATCPSMPGLVAGLQHSGPTREPIKIGMLWLDAHPDFNTPGDDAQRIARRHAGRRRDRPRAAGHAPRREARSAAARSSRRDGRRAADRSARAAPARQLDDRAAERRRSAQHDARRSGRSSIGSIA